MLMSPGSRIHLYARACWPNVERFGKIIEVSLYTDGLLLHPGGHPALVKLIRPEETITLF